MGRWSYGLVVAAAIVACGCASPSAPSELASQLGDGGVGGGACVDGASCSSGNPGGCNLGHAVCTGGVTTCVPNATTQSCYTGPAGTQDVGACKSGTQTCVGALGDCEGQVLPAAQENCFNDEDDDCDGVVNNGCPDHLATGTPRVLPAHGNAAGGSPFSLRCPANAYVGKIVIYGDLDHGSLSGIDLYCVTPTLVPGTSSYSVTTTVAASPLSRKGNVITPGETGTFDCGTGFVPGWWTTGTFDATGIDELGLFCGTSALMLGADNKLAITLTKQGNGVPDGYNISGATPFEDDCMQGEVLIGYDGRVGDWLDQLAAVCAPLTVVYK